MCEKRNPFRRHPGRFAEPEKLFHTFVVCKIKKRICAETGKVFLGGKNTISRPPAFPAGREKGPGFLREDDDPHRRFRALLRLIKLSPQTVSECLFQAIRRFTSHIPGKHDADIR